MVETRSVFACLRTLSALERGVGTEVRHNRRRDNQGNEQRYGRADSVAHLELNGSNLHRQPSNRMLGVRAEQHKERSHEVRNDRLEKVLERSTDEDGYRKR